MKIETLINQALKGSESIKSPLLDLDPYNNYSDGRELSGGDFINGENTFIFSGPPLLDHMIKYPKYVYPIGNTMSFSISQNRGYIPLTEFGSQDTRHIPSKMNYNITMSRVLDAHQDLGYCLYRWQVAISKDRKATGMEFSKLPGHNPLKTQVPTFDEYKHFFSLNSELFLCPFGLLVVQLDGYNNIKVAGYAENCKIPNKSLQLSANPTTDEPISILVTRLKPALGLKLSTKAKKNYTLKAPL